MPVDPFGLPPARYPVSKAAPGEAARGVEILFIEPQRDYGPILRRYVRPDDPSQLIFLPNPDHLAQLRKLALDAGHSIEDRLVRHNTLEKEADAFLYGNCLKVAEVFLEMLRGASRKVTGDRDHLFPAHATRALTVAILNRLVASIRGQVQLLATVAAQPRAHLRIVLRPYGEIEPLAEFFGTLKGATVEFVSEHLTIAREKPVFRRTGADALAFFPNQFQGSATFDFNRLRREIKRNSVLICTNLSDRQYKTTALPIIEGLIERGLPFAAITNEVDDEVAGMMRRGRKWAYVRDRPEAEYGKNLVSNFFDEILGSAFRTFAKYCERQTDPWVRALRGSFIEYFRGQILPLLFYANQFIRGMRRIIDKCDCVVALPERYFEAHLAVGLAKEKGVRTVEVQSGPISPSPRYLKPSVDQVLCMDPFSQSVYADYLGLGAERTAVVGSPRLDHEIAPVRGLYRHSARAKIGALKGVDRQPVCMLATQPFGLEEMRTIVSLAIAAVKPIDDAVLFIKQHHSENDGYAEAYRALAQEHGFDRLIIDREATSMMAAVASNVVMTHFSTVGIEAFALRRPVICINPFPGRPPYDLVEIGVAKEARSDSELEALIRTLITQPAALQDRRLSYLRDGLAVQRCLDHIVPGRSGIVAVHGESDGPSAAGDADLPAEPARRPRKPAAAKAKAQQRGAARPPRKPD